MPVLLIGTFDDLRSRDVRLLEEAAKFGNLHVGLWSDQAVQAREGAPPKFSARERLYLLESLRFVSLVSLLESTTESNALAEMGGETPSTWVVDEGSDTPAKRALAQAQHLRYQVITNTQIMGLAWPRRDAPILEPNQKRVMVTGCFDWFHSGHVRFFEEAAALGQLYVVVGHDANIRLLKGEGHPLLPQEERLYMVRAVRYVHQAMLSTGHGWLDAEPEIALIRPHSYVVNDDGDKPEKRAFCAQNGIEYVVMKRIPKAGLPQRESTTLRGF